MEKETNGYLSLMATSLAEVASDVWWSTIPVSISAWIESTAEGCWKDSKEASTHVPSSSWWASSALTPSGIAGWPGSKTPPWSNNCWSWRAFKILCCNPTIQSQPIRKLPNYKAWINQYLWNSNYVEPINVFEQDCCVVVDIVSNKVYSALSVFPGKRKTILIIYLSKDVLNAITKNMKKFVSWHEVSDIAEIFKVQMQHKMELWWLFQQVQCLIFKIIANVQRCFRLSPTLPRFHSDL